MRHAICLLVLPGILYGFILSVAAQKKKVVVFLAAVVLSGTVLVRAVRSTGESSRPNSPESETTSLSAGDSNFPSGADKSPGTPELFFKMMLMVLLVVVLGAAAIYISRRLIPKIANLPGKRIRVIETAYLGPRKAVHLLKIDGQLVLIGSTREHIAKLADIGNTVADSPPEYEAVD